LLKAKIIKLWV
ncbi:hypothetical protein VCHC80A1_03109B, partial [Vibrio cholerae HC-80A1]